MESLDYDDIKLADDPFEPITKVLDPLFQHEEEVELPERCQEFLEQFQRERQEQLQAYLVRHQTMLKKLKDLNVDVPPPLARWHLLMRAGIPRWIHPQVKRMCNVELTTEKVSRALARMFGADTTPNAKDGEVTTFKHDVHMVDYDPYDNVDDEALDETYYHDDDEVYYQWEDDSYGYGSEDEINYADNTVGEEDVPPELDEASLAVEDAFINYLDSRKKMRELALSRGFYSVVVVDLNDNNFSGRGSSKSYGKSRNTDGGKGKGKSKGKGGGKSKGMGNGKGAGRHPLPGARRFIFGRRSPLESSSSTSTTAKSTTSGSTAQHGPRFKRDRLPTSGIKEVPDDADMVTDVPTEVTPAPGDFHRHEEINFVSQEVGWAIMDSGPQELSVAKQSGTS